MLHDISLVQEKAQQILKSGANERSAIQNYAKWLQNFEKIPAKCKMMQITSQVPKDDWLIPLS